MFCIVSLCLCCQLCQKFLLVYLFCWGFCSLLFRCIGWNRMIQKVVEKYATNCCRSGLKICLFTRDKFGRNTAIQKSRCSWIGLLFSLFSDWNFDKYLHPSMSRICLHWSGVEILTTKITFCSLSFDSRLNSLNFGAVSLLRIGAELVSWLLRLESKNEKNMIPIYTGTRLS